MARKYDMDRRAYLKTVGAVGASLTVAGCGGQQGNGGGTGTGTGTGTTTGSGTEVIPGTAPGFPPFEIKEDGELTGFDVDLLAAVVAEADGYTLGEWQEFEFSSLIPSLTSDKIDVVAAAMTITDKRDETIDFSDPYYSANQSVLVAAGSDFQPSELADLSGHPIGAQKGTTGETVIEENLINTGDLEESNYSGYGSYVLAVQDLENGNIDAIVIDEPVGSTFEANRDVEVAFTYETGEQYGFGVRTDDDDLTQALNSGLQSVRDSGRYDELTNEWFGGSGGTATMTTMETTTGT
jgi:polar amino acid transport system substrate-binding protein